MKKKKIIIAILILILGASLLLVGIFFKTQASNPSNNPKEPTDNLLGEDRRLAQKEVVSIIEKYITNNSEIKNYLDKKGDKRITLKELKEELKIDISEFENSKYECIPEYTIIDFSEDYSDYTISLTCEALLKKD